ncbi:MAG TPA: ABC transporter ATP-binding protein [Bryobacteraceae bacterium]|nr:ABC transporter ATP-binding protein [Bryobacteraceae bacterium]
MPDAILTAKNVGMSYGSNGTRVRALDDVSLSFAGGTLTLIMGPSGSGKTTLLSLLGCLMTPDTGSVFVDGTEVTSLDERERTELRRGQIGFIFQAFRLFHSLSAFENVMIAAEIGGSRDQQSSDAARQSLEKLGLGDKLHLKPNALSGGEKQRVAIARALLPNPKILLADEPTAALDAGAGRQIGEILRDLAEQQKRTIVVVSHDHRWANFSHRTVVLEDGRLVDDRRN